MSQCHRTVTIYTSTKPRKFVLEVGPCTGLKAIIILPQDFGAGTLTEHNGQIDFKMIDDASYFHACTAMLLCWELDRLMCIQQSIKRENFDL